MGVRVDHQFHAQLKRAPHVYVAEIEALEIRIDFQRGARLGGGAKDGLHVQVSPFPLTDQSPRRMGDDVHVGVADRGQGTRRELLPSLAQPGMHRRHDQVEFGQHLVAKVERAIGQHLHLGAGQQPKGPAHFPVDLLDLGSLAAQVAGGDSLDDAQAVRVIGH